MSDEHSKNVIQVWIAGITLFGVIVTAFFTWMSKQNIETETDIIVKLTGVVQTQQTQIDSLNNQVSKLINQAQVQSLDRSRVESELLILKAQVKSQDNEKELLKNWIDTQPTAMWIKERRGDGLFYLVYLNDEYTAQFGVVRDAYIGRNDYQVNTKDIADGYFKNDLKVFNSERPVIAVEKAPSKNGAIKVLSFKWRLETSENTYIAGMAIPIDDLKNYILQGDAE